MEEVVLSTDRSGRPLVVRVGQTVRRPVGPGSALASSLLLHLEEVGFEASPRFLGNDAQGRQVVTFIEGDVDPAPVWQHDDLKNAEHLGEVASLVRLLHAATINFLPPNGAEPIRPLPLSGSTWSHGDIGYQNIVYRQNRAIAFIDWEFCAPANAMCDVAGLLALSVRAPRPDVDDNDRRTRAVDTAVQYILDGYGLDDGDVVQLLLDAAVVLEDAATFWEQNEQPVTNIANARWRADWFRQHAQGSL